MPKRFSNPLIRRLFSTKSPFQFTPKDLKFYQENGYLVYPNLIPHQDIDELRARTAKMIDEYPFQKEISFFESDLKRGADFIHTGDKIHFFFEPGAINPKTQTLTVDKQHAFNKIGHAMHDLDPVYRKFSYREIFKSILLGIGYQNPALCQSMYIFKSPKIGQQVSPHTDNSYLITNPLSCCGLWVALDDAKKSNGCLWGVPGSHKEKTTKFMKRNAEATETYYEENESEKKKSYEINKSVPLEVPKGSLVVLHGDFVHYSDDNLSNETRHAYTMHFVETEGCKWDQGNWLQRGKEMPFRLYYKEI